MCKKGLGIKKIQDVSAVLSAKLGRNVITDLDNILVKVFYAKYLTKDNFLEAKKTASA